MYDKFKDALDKAKETQETELALRIENQTLTEQEKKTILSRIKHSTSLKEVVSDADLVIEAIPENKFE